MSDNETDKVPDVVAAVSSVVNDPELVVGSVPAEDADEDAVAKRRAEDRAAREANPDAPVVRAADPRVGGESFPF